MADYDFYRNVYLGTAITEKQFPALAAQAASVLESYGRKYIVEEAGENSRKMAVCAMAEVLQNHHRVSRFTNAAVGSVSVRYEKDNVPLDRRLYQAAQVYLDIYRGVG